MAEIMIDDSKALDQYIEILGAEGSEFIIEIINTFLSEAYNLFDQLDHSLATGDSVTFNRIAHTLKTGCLTMGAATLADDFLKLEVAGASGNLPAYGGLVEKCKIRYQKLKVELEQKKAAFS